MSSSVFTSGDTVVNIALDAGSTVVDVALEEVTYSIEVEASAIDPEQIAYLDGLQASCTNALTGAQQAERDTEQFKIDSEQFKIDTEQARDDARNSKSESSDSASAALNSENAAKNSEISAENSKSSALASEGLASQSKVEAVNSASAALVSQNAAKSSEIVSTTAAGQASSSANTAVTSSQKSMRWSDAPENEEIEPGQFSSKHWAIIAERYGEAATNAIIFRGPWDATTGAPPIPTPEVAEFYKITVAGNIDGVEYSLGDNIIWDTVADEWFRIDNSERQITDSLNMDSSITSSSAKAAMTLNNKVDSKTPEAPNDNNPYVRKNLDWEQIFVDVKEAPNDGSQYVRKNLDWEQVSVDVNEAPSDDKQYARKNEAWVEVGNGMPVGSIMSWYKNTPPPGWLECNGSTINSATYPGLVEFLTNDENALTATLPDFRGEFLRGWANDKTGITDAGRAFGSTQNDEFKSHHHLYGRGIPTPSSIHLKREAGTAIGNESAFYVESKSIGSSAGVDSVDIKATGGTETRPTNTAVMFVMKATDYPAANELTTIATVQAELNELENNLPTPVGTVSWWTKQTPPLGWLEANGAEIDVNHYPELHAHFLGTDNRTPWYTGKRSTWIVSTATNWRGLGAEIVDGLSINLPDGQNLINFDGFPYGIITDFTNKYIQVNNSIIRINAPTVPENHVRTYTVIAGSLADVGTNFRGASEWTLYERLHDATKAFLPDLRGEFIRGWDNGRDVDPSRNFHSGQQDAIRNITGELVRTRKERIASLVPASGAFSQVYRIDSGIGGAQGSAFGYWDVTFDASNVVPTANENRPRSVALMPIVKAFSAPVTQGTIDVSEAPTDIAQLQTYARRNIVINGDMRVHQRGFDTHNPVTPANNTKGYAADRWYLYNSQPGASVTVSNNPSNEVFGNTMEVINNTATSYTGTNTEFAAISYKIEGYDYSILANGDFITISFSAKTNKIGTYHVLLRGGTPSQSMFIPFVVTQSDVMTRYELTLPVNNNTGIA